MSLQPEHFLKLFPADEQELIRPLLTRATVDAGETRYERILAALEVEPLMKPAPSTGKISSQAHNDMLQGLHADLLRLFQVYGELDQSLAAHEHRTWSLISEIKAQLASLESRIDLVRSWARRPAGEGAPIVLDLGGGSRSRADRDPELLHPVHHRMRFDSVFGEATLPIASQIDRLRSSSGGRTAQLFLLSQDGGFPVEGRQGLEHPIDGRDDTAWWSRQVSRSPVKDPEATGMPEGVSATLELTFESAGPVTELMITPFGPSGIDVLSVVCYNEKGDPIRPVWVGEEKDAVYKPFYADKPFVLHGPAFDTYGIKAIRIRIGQRHARLRELVCSDDAEKADPGIVQWAKTRGLILPDRANAPQTTQLLYEYLYGIRSIEAYARTYHPRAVYISDPITTRKPLDQFSIEIEHEPTEAYGQRASSLRLYALIDGRQIPILPRKVNGKENRKAEMVPLQFAVDGRAALPFAHRVGGEFELYEDGDPVPYMFFEVDAHEIRFPQFKPSSVYWASYDVADGPGSGLTLDVTQLGIAPKERLERFAPSLHTPSGTGRVIELSHEPWIDVSKINKIDFDPNQDYRPIDVTLIGSFPDTKLTRIRMEDASQFDDPTRPDHPIVQNVTDYLSGIRRMMIPYDAERKIYSFRQEGNKLIFADPLPHATIEVKYHTLVDSVRIAAVLERNGNARSSQTDRIRKISVHPRYAGAGLV